MHRVNSVWILLCASFFGQFLYAQTALSSGTERVYIGLLDDAREEMVNWKPGVASERLIRPAFVKSQSGWRQVESASIPARMNWTVAFHGKNIGRLKSEAIPSTSRPNQGHTEYLTAVQAIVTPSIAVPSVGVPSEKYSPMGMGPTKGRRPLVVVSKPYTSDPDGWKRLSRPPDAVEALVRAAFRRAFPHTFRCRDEKIVQHNWKFPNSSLKLPTIYASNKGTFLVETSLDAGNCGYVDDPDDQGSSPWFFVMADGQSRRIGAFMSLLDAGDYDSDGRSELIFILNQPEDTDGFVLFDADLNKQASLLWTYH